MPGLKLIALSLIVSFISSLFIAGFIYALNAYGSVIDETISSNLLLALIAFLSIIAGYLILRVTHAKHAMGAGVENIIYEYHLPFRKLRKTNLVSKFFSTITTIGGGGSGGLQGPSIYFGGYIGGLLSDRLKLSYPERKALMLSGIASSLSYIFQAPLGSLFYAIEIPYRKDLETKYIIPVFSSSIIGYVMSSVIMGKVIYMPQITISLARILEPINIVIYVLLSLFITVLVYVFIYLDRLIEKYKKTMLGTNDLLPVFMLAALVGVTVFIFPQVGGIGYDKFLEIYVEKIYLKTPLLLLVLIILKMIATSATIRSGASAGYFGPSLFIGGLSGLVFYSIIGKHLSSLPPLVYVYAGIAAFYGAASTAPLGISILVTEISGSYTLIFPTILSSFIVRELMGNTVLYKTQRKTRLRASIERIITVAYRANSIDPKILNAGIHDAAHSIPVPLLLGDPTDKAYHIYINSNHTYIPVVDENHTPIGAIDVKKLVSTKDSVITPKIINPIPTIEKSITIKEATRLLSRYNVETLLLKDEKGEYAGIITTENLEKYILSRIWWKHKM
ncbi:chloride channel protein [Staphylothermus hellenicus]|uniref:Cl-channel voltage-gated family protein n=1 Tax=Staphylothermus hellenicus (strain DSM 12710 / JCM 10830 / BK20S6-10-b1 / P8) TaxID=591019 RepID=D7DB26_STAHD|nr:chloride channel protein [Staphylothermus hellenicus]ADI31373.1 Cl- channel voltage-gated family protein [Staphylothermus hellenicus DSM 12710]